MQKIWIALVAQSKSWIFRSQENIPLWLQIQNLKIYRHQTLKPQIGCKPFKSFLKVSFWDYLIQFFLLIPNVISKILKKKTEKCVGKHSLVAEITARMKFLDFLLVYTLTTVKSNQPLSSGQVDLELFEVFDLLKLVSGTNEIFQIVSAFSNSKI